MKKTKIYVAGHNGMVGSAICKILQKKKNIELFVESKSTLNLLDQNKVSDFLKQNNFDEIYIAAAKVGGIHANNTYPADFIYQNLMIQLNIINGAHLSGVNKLLFLGSSCIYPKEADQPMSENALLSGQLENTNEPYAIAKIAGIKTCESYNRQYGTDYRSVMPTNLYGIGDNYHSDNSHVIPGLIKRFHDAKVSEQKYIKIWGTGEPKREFLFVDDMASACIHIMNLSRNDLMKVSSPMLSHINIGSNREIKIIDLAHMISKVVGFNGKILTDVSKPDGALRKLMDSSILNSLGWNPKYNLEDGLVITYQDFLKNIKPL